MTTLIFTPSQTIGPFYGSALIWDGSAEAVSPDEPGAVEIRGTLADGEGPFVYPEGVIEFSSDRQFARTQTDYEGNYRVVIRRPAEAQPLGDGRAHAPHLNVTVFGRGLLKPLLTRMYFPDQQEANASDPVLGLVPEGRRASMTAREEADGSLHFDICVQGHDESVFFAL
jgi:protocatechuate 3,4-dioxygenase alpha subunit